MQPHYMPMQKQANIEMIQRDFGKAATRYDQHAHLQQHVSDMLYQRAASLFPSVTKVVDIGCGTGEFSSLAKDTHPTWSISQLDISYPMCDIAHAKHPKNPTMQANTESLPLASCSMDAAFSSLCWQWVKHPVDAFQEVRRVLVPQGRFLCATLGEGTLIELKRAFKQLDIDPPIHSFLSTDTLKDYLYEAGFSEVQLESRIERFSYPSVWALLQSMKHIGATFKHSASDTTFKGRRVFQQLEELYPLYQYTQGKHTIYASWEVIVINAIV